MENIQTKIEQLDSKIKNLVEKKNAYMQKKKEVFLKQIEKKELFNWDQKIFNNALTYIQTQKQENSKIYQSWIQENDKS